jgi:hypothetical protein
MSPFEKWLSGQAEKNNFFNFFIDKVDEHKTMDKI